MDNRSDWKPWVKKLTQRRARSKEMGGQERLEKYFYSRGRLDVRQRLELLFDKGTFKEIGAMVGGEEDIPADAFVCGSGLVNGRPTLAGGEDFSVLGGSIGAGGTAKRFRLAELAKQENIPLVMILDGAGHRLTDTGGGNRAPNDLLALADLGGSVPMLCLIMGVSAGHSAITAPLSDFTIMTSYGSMFTGGPPLVEAATGEKVTKEELGGVEICAETAGTVHNVAKDDRQCLEMAREYLSYMPQHNGGKLPSRTDKKLDTEPRLVDELRDIIPPNDKKPYDMHEVIELIVDKNSFFEVQADFGKSLVCGLAFMGGKSVAIIANNPLHIAGALDSEAAIKGVDFCNTISHFGHPTIFLADNPGVMAGIEAEKSGILRWGGMMFKAQRNMKNPKIQITMRKAFGFGAVTMAQNPFDKQTLTFCLPSVNMAAMPAESGGKAANFDADTQSQVEEDQRAGPYRLANRLSTDDIILPEEMRNAILWGLELSSERYQS